MRHAFLDEYSSRDSFLHRLDPRLKIALFLGCILFVISTPPDRFRTFGLYALVLGMLTALAQLPLGYVLKRSAGIMPFVLCIALFLPFARPGLAAVSWSAGPFRVAISYAGLLAFGNVLIKSWLSIICMIILTSTTQFADLLKGLQRLKVSGIFILIVSFMYRYVFVMEDETEKMLMARQARSIRPGRWAQVRTLSNMVGVLFIRSYERAERVYVAMRCRGYDGSIRTLHESCVRKQDLYFLGIVLAALLNIRFAGA